MRLKAFTIVELLAVLSIIAIIMTIGIPKIKGIQDHGRLTQVKGDLRTLQSALESYRVFSTPAEFPPTSTKVCADYLVGATPQIITIPLYDPFGATATTEYLYSRSTNKKFYALSSVGLDKTSAMGTIADTGIVACGGDDTCVSNGTVISGNPPGIPLAPVISNPTPTSLTVSWGASSGATSYTVSRSGAADMSSATDLGAQSSGFTNGSLASGTHYWYTVTAVNAAGLSLPSPTGTGTTIGVPGAPVIGLASAGNTQVSISFTAPASDGGSAITVYTATSNPGGFTGTSASDSTPITVTGLSNGTPYTFTVTATNVAGTSAASAVSNSVTPAGVPGAPTSVVATAGSTTASVTFVAPSSNGGGAMTYTVTGGGTDTNAGTNNLTHAITGLTNGTPYTFTVKATNSMGQGAGGTSNTVTPAGVPNAPSSVVATAGNTTASVTFVAPSSNGGGAMTYTVTGGGTDTNAGTNNLTHAITGLTNGTPYTFTVTATNSVGTGAGGVASAVTPAGVPNAPSSVVATAGSTTASVTFVAPSSNGGGAMTYTVTGGGTDSNAGTNNLTHAITGLTNGTPYTFTVKATNSVGQGAGGVSNTVTPAGVPGAPTSVVATAGSTTASVTFVAPSSNGGGAMTYTVTGGGTDTNAGTNNLTHAITGLTNGTPYTFTVTATNSVGQGAGGVSNTMTPVAPDIGCRYDGSNFVQHGSCGDISNWNGGSVALSGQYTQSSYAQSGTSTNGYTSCNWDKYYICKNW
ncbi:MAG: fibronectin type III domain-containing protein [Candidatus Omnitrophica bacterium]|nr:fibronectin type III domain-containing protein [Candidatus Omnitrophota bacterium]